MLDDLTKRLEDLNFSHEAIIQTMRDDFDYSEQEHSQIGIFWYDVNTDQLFGVNKMDENAKDFVKNGNNEYIKSYPKLHKQIWKKESYRGKDKRFIGDYTMIPRGRVSFIKDKGFIVFIGKWIDEYPNVKSDIIYEFELPKNNTRFVYDEHLDIGHDWSDEII